MVGKLYQEQPDLEVINGTHFELWFASSLDDDASQEAKLAAYDAASLEDKVGVLNNVLASWEETAKRSLLDRDGFDSTLDLVRAVGWDNTLKLIFYALVEAGFGVYVGDAFIEIYKVEVEPDVMAAPRYSQREMESAVEIAFMGGYYGFRMEDSREMMASFIEWAVKFEKTPYPDEEWMELIDSFAIEMFLVEMERGRAICDASHRTAMPGIHSSLDLTKFEQWQGLHDNAWIYLPKRGDRILTKGEFSKLCNGDARRAHALFFMCVSSGQHPATVIGDSGGLEQLFAEAA